MNCHGYFSQDGHYLHWDARMHVPGLYPGQISFSPPPPDTTWHPGGNIDRSG